MLRSVMLQRALRALAIVIVVVAIIDPAMSSNRRVPPVVAIIGGELDPVLSAEVSSELGDDHTIVDGAFSGADASVLLEVNRRDAAGMLAGSRQPMIAVMPPADEPRVRITDLRAPRVAPHLAPTRIEVRAEVAGARAGALVVELRESGVLLDRQRLDLNGERMVVATFLFTARKPGGSLLTVHASFAGSSTSAADSASLLIESRDEPLRVLFYDARASWMSTFVRRTLEADRRFDVSSRTSTSRSLSIGAGDAPSTLSDASRLAAYDAIVVGAPDALSAASVAGLDRYLRERGGAVLLLFDVPVAGNVRDLIGSVAWQTSQSDVALPVLLQHVEDSARTSTSTRDSAPPPPLRVSEFSFPLTLSAVATIHGTVATNGSVPVLFGLPVGAGRLVVSTAFDTWRYRESEQSRFAKVWPALIGEAAASSLDELDVDITPSLVRPGERVELTITARDLVLGAIDLRGIDVRASAQLHVKNARLPLRLYPTSSTGVFEATFSAPQDTGGYVVAATVSAGAVIASDSARFIVGDAVRRADRMSPPLLASFATASGGAVIESSRLVDLARAIDEVAPGASQRVMWHPMRSPWWILPFAFLLGAEWWLRRRGGRS